MPIERARLDRMISLMDAWLTQREQEQAASTYDDNDKDCELREGNTMPVAPSAPFSDSPPDMPKEPMWGGHPPVPIEHI